MPLLPAAPMTSSSTGSTSSTFWREVSGARPGRVSGGPLAVQAPRSDRAAAHTFQDFQASVSDAWDIDEPLTPGPCAGGQGGPAQAVPGCGPHQQQLPQSITPVHTQNASYQTQTSRRSPNRQNVGSRPQAPNPPSTDPETEKERNKCAKFENLLSQSPVIMHQLEKISWSGIPGKFRSRVWKILCGYLPAGKSDEVLKRKRDEYNGYVNQYFNNKEEDIHKDTFRQIAIDVPRMSPLVGLFQQRCVQEMVERILYIWAIRHPASGYVQGINDLVTPFLMVFLQDFVEKDVTRNSFIFEELDEVIRNNIEADSFWCMTKVLDGIQDNYTFAQPGIQIKIRQLEELLKRVDLKLHNHIVGHDVQYLQFSFRWMNNLLLRELPLNATIRLWDTYLAEPDGFSKFHLYVCAAFLSRWKSELEQKKDFQGILLFIQNVPTAKWHDKDISLLVAEAYKLKYMFADAPSHLTECRINKPLL